MCSSVLSGRLLLLNSFSAWLQEHENASLPVIRRRMEIVTGLIYGPETASEYFQVGYCKNVTYQFKRLKVT